MTVAIQKNMASDAFENEEKEVVSFLQQSLQDKPC